MAKYRIVRYGKGFALKKKLLFWWFYADGGLYPNQFPSIESALNTMEEIKRDEKARKEEIESHKHDGTVVMEVEI